MKTHMNLGRNFSFSIYFYYPSYRREAHSAGGETGGLSPPEIVKAAYRSVEQNSTLFFVILRQP